MSSDGAADPADKKTDAADSGMNRRDFLRILAGGIGMAAFGGLTAMATRLGRTARPSSGSGVTLPPEGRPGLVWQLDPAKCTQCGQCATECVLNPSAVKCVHAFKVCGYCELCFGHYKPGVQQGSLDESAEKQICPTGAIKRSAVDATYYEYSIDEALCNGCSKCVLGCTSFGNGSLFLQVRHDRCVNCNECSIARACPADAFRRVPASQPYLLKGVEQV
jgi:Na+-translocating ferredoxin:NAD+ oxidoreductase subunit B